MKTIGGASISVEYSTTDIEASNSADFEFKQQLKNIILTYVYSERDKHGFKLKYFFLYL
jgi:hypothetical protein